MKTCPRCDQGRLFNVRVRNAPDCLIVCEECEACWNRGDPIAPGNWFDFGTLLREKGLRPIWDEVEILGEA